MCIHRNLILVGHIDMYTQKFDTIWTYTRYRHVYTYIFHTSWTYSHMYTQKSILVGHTDISIQRNLRPVLHTDICIHRNLIQVGRTAICTHRNLILIEYAVIGMQRI